MTFVVGVDGGGTRTRAVIVDEEGRELGRGHFAGVVVTEAEAERAADAVREATQRAAERAGVVLPASALWAGLAGAGDERARTAIRAALVERDVAHETTVGTDVEAAFYDAFAQGAGVLVIAGTGSIVWAKNEAGETFRVGGWGRHLGDEGSGFHLGLDALRLVARAEDGRAPPTTLATSLLAALGLESSGDLVGWADRASKGDVAALAPLVVEAADGGDEGASEVVDHAVAALRAHVVAALERMGSTSVTEVVLWGGLLAGGGPLRGRVAAVLGEVGLSVIDRELDPPMGAARLALARHTR